jgi:hypothetical protein
MFPNNNPTEHVTYPKAFFHILANKKYAFHFESFMGYNPLCAETLIKYKANMAAKSSACVSIRCVCNMSPHKFSASNCSDSSVTVRAKHEVHMP